MHVRHACISQRPRPCQPITEPRGPRRQAPARRTPAKQLAGPPRVRRRRGDAPARIAAHRCRGRPNASRASPAATAAPKRTAPPDAPPDAPGPARSGKRSGSCARRLRTGAGGRDREVDRVPSLPASPAPPPRRAGGTRRTPPPPTGAAAPPRAARIRAAPRCANPRRPALRESVPLPTARALRPPVLRVRQGPEADGRLRRRCGAAMQAVSHVHGAGVLPGREQARLGTRLPTDQPGPQVRRRQRVRNASARSGEAGGRGSERARDGQRIALAHRRLRQGRRRHRHERAAPAVPPSAVPSSRAQTGTAPRRHRASCSSAGVSCSATATKPTALHSADSRPCRSTHLPHG